jgi:hypothetical protein
VFSTAKEKKRETEHEQAKREIRDSIDARILDPAGKLRRLCLVSSVV